MKKKKFYDVPSIEILSVQQDSNFASSFGGQIGEGSGSIITNSVYESE